MLLGVERIALVTKPPEITKKTRDGKETSLLGFGSVWFGSIPVLCSYTKNSILHDAQFY